MAWKAKSDIGDYKEGDIVPDELAVVWNEMYKESPVEQVHDAPRQKEKLADPDPEKEEPKREKQPRFLHKRSKR